MPKKKGAKHGDDGDDGNNDGEPFFTEKSLDEILTQTTEVLVSPDWLKKYNVKKMSDQRYIDFENL